MHCMQDIDYIRKRCLVAGFGGWRECYNVTLRSGPQVRRVERIHPRLAIPAFGDARQFDISRLDIDLRRVIAVEACPLDHFGMALVVRVCDGSEELFVSWRTTDVLRRATAQSLEQTRIEDAWDRVGKTFDLSVCPDTSCAFRGIVSTDFTGS